MFGKGLTQSELSNFCFRDPAASRDSLDLMAKKRNM